jgi:hypothetical protein
MSDLALMTDFVKENYWVMYEPFYEYISNIFNKLPWSFRNCPHLKPCNLSVHKQVSIWPLVLQRLRTPDLEAVVSHSNNITMMNILVNKPKYMNSVHD